MLEPYYEEIKARADAQGSYVSDYIAALLMAHVDSTPRPVAGPGQTELLSRQEVLSKTA